MVLHRAHHPTTAICRKCSEEAVQFRVQSSTRCHIARDAFIVVLLSEFASFAAKDS